MNTILKILLIGVFSLISCTKFEYDPNQSNTIASQKELNRINVEKLLSSPGDSIILVALIGDSHIYYESLGDVVESINKIPEVDFVVHAGDMTDHGFVLEYEKGVSYLQKLHKPFVTVIGNHDLLANGKQVYRSMFGSLNFSFVYHQTKFIFFDSNGREYGFSGNIPELPWIYNEIHSESTADKIVLVSHVPFFNTDYDATLVEPYKEMLRTDYGNKKIILSLSGHQHVWYEVNQDTEEVPHIGAGSTKERNFYLIRIAKEGVSYEKKSY